MHTSHRIASVRAEVVEADLPGPCAATSTYRDGVLWIVVDPSKPDAYEQAEEMLRTSRPLTSLVLRALADLPRPRPRSILENLPRATILSGVAGLAAVLVDQLTPLVGVLA